MEDEVFSIANQLIVLLTDYALDIVGALLLLIAGWIVAGWIEKHTGKVLKRIDRVDATLRSFVTNLVRYAILVLVMIAVFAQSGIQTTSIIAVLGAAGLAAGLALQGTLANIAAGMLLLFLRPFRVGESIDAGSSGDRARNRPLFDGASNLGRYLSDGTELAACLRHDPELLATADPPTESRDWH